MQQTIQKKSSRHIRLIDNNLHGCNEIIPRYSVKRYNPTRQVLGRPVCDRGAIPRTLVQSNVVRSRLIILINEEINEANWMVSNIAKLDRRTKQHSQFEVSAINGSRDMARTKSWQKKKKKITKRIGW